jgi:hypothetical protein
MAYALQKTLARMGGLDNSLHGWSKSYQFNPAVTLEVDQRASVEALIVDWAAVSTLPVQYYAISKVIGDATITTPTEPKAENEMLANLLANINGQPGKHDNLFIPGPQDAIFVGAIGTGSYDIVDLADVDLLTFIGLFQPASASLRFSDGEQMPNASPLASGRRVSHASRKG